MAVNHTQYYPPPPDVSQPPFSAPAHQQTFDPPPTSSGHTSSYGGATGSHTQYYPPPSQSYDDVPSPQFTPPLPAQHFDPPPQAQPVEHVHQFQKPQTPLYQPPQQQYVSPPTSPLPMSPGLSSTFSQSLTLTPQPPATPLDSPESSAAAQQLSHIADDVGTFNGGSYRISHRSSNTMLTLQLAINCPIVAKPGAMIAMSPSVTVQGNVKFSLKKVVAGGSITQTTFTGPGEVLLAPPGLGDIVPIKLVGGDTTWRVGKHSWIAVTQGVQRDMKSQSIGKALFSGEGWYTYTMSGTGILWICSFGAIVRKDLREGEKYIIDNGHLVAWNCKYSLERVATGGIVSHISAGEGLVCKFVGPGSIYMQTRNPAALRQLIAGSGGDVTA